MLNKENQKVKAKNIYKKVSTIIMSIIMLVVIIACLFLFIQVLNGKKPSLFGYRLYYILTDSMTPDLQVNDVILARAIDTLEEAKSIKEGDVITYIAAEGIQEGLTITHKVIREPYFDESRNKMVLLTMGVKPGAPVDPPVPLENIQAVMVRKVGFVATIYSFIISSYGLIILIIVPMSIIITLLVIKLIKTIKSKPENKESSEEEIARKAVEEYREQERIKAEIAKKAVEDYIKSQQKNE